MTIQIFLSILFTLAATTALAPYLLGFKLKDEMKNYPAELWIMAIILSHSIFITDAGFRLMDLPTSELIFTGMTHEYFGIGFYAIHIAAGIIPDTQTRKYMSSLPRAIASAPQLFFWEIPKVIWEALILPPLKKVKLMVAK